MHQLGANISAELNLTRSATMLIALVVILASVPVAYAQKSAHTTTVESTSSDDAGRSVSDDADDDESGDIDGRKVIARPGVEIEISTKSKEIRVSNDERLAREQVEEYPDSPESHFVLAVALTRTSKVEQALMEVRKARKLAVAKGGASYFDEMIDEYEEVLERRPQDNDIRYHLAWAYYMKAYVLTKYSKRVLSKEGAQPKQWHKDWVGQSAGSSAGESTGKPAGSAIEAVQNHNLQYAWKNAAPSVIPQIKKYYELALAKLDDLLERNPSDVWATLYRAHLKAEYTGNLEPAMKVWRTCQKKYPNNPAPYFFLGEGYLKKGNLRESLLNVSRAIALRGLGN